jgi:hypothetical protein
MTHLQVHPIHQTDSRTKDVADNLPSLCLRCKGMLVSTFCISPDEAAWEYQIPVWRCLSCGDVFDATILKHRRQIHHDSQN